MQTNGYLRKGIEYSSFRLMASRLGYCIMLVKDGYKVVAFDFDINEIKKLNTFEFPIFEPGLKELVENQTNKKKLVFSSDVKKLKNVQVIWFCYDTPVLQNDKADVNYVYEQITYCFNYFPKKCIIIISSQLPVGSTRHLKNKYINDFSNNEV